LQQDPLLKSENKKREPILIPIVGTGVTQTSFKAKPKRTIGLLPLFKTETYSESETEFLPVHSRYINNVLRRNVSHDPTFGVYQDDTDGYFKIGRYSFKYNDKHVFLDGKN